MCIQMLSNELIKPVQRVPRYEMLLKELHKNTAKLGEPTVDLELCLARLRSVNDFNNEEIRVLESKDKLHRLQARLGGRERLVGSQKMVKFQHHIREQELIKIHGRGDRRVAPCHLALLTEELIYSRPVEAGKSNLKLHARIKLEPASTRFEDLPDDDERGSGFANRIAIISAKRTFIIYCPGPRGNEDKEDWLMDLNRAQVAAREATGQQAEAYHHVAISQPVYQPDGPACSICSAQFGVRRRRHHCRLCGGLVCDPCASSMVDLSKLNNPLETDEALGQSWGVVERVCDDCVKWAKIFYQDYLRFIPPGLTHQLARTSRHNPISDASRYWIVPVVQKVQETRLNQLLHDRANNPTDSGGDIDAVAVALTVEEETAQELLVVEQRQARVKAAWRYAMKHAHDQDFHRSQVGSQVGSQVHAGGGGSGGNLGGLWSGWLWKRGGGTSTFGRQNWKRRWFVLTNEELSYYETVEDMARMTAHQNTAKGALDLRDYMIASVDRDHLQCELKSRAGGRDLMIAKCDASSHEAVASITTRDREDFLMLASVLQGLLEVTVATAMQISKNAEFAKKEAAFREAEYYAKQADETHANLQDIHAQIEATIDDAGLTQTQSDAVLQRLASSAGAMERAPLPARPPGPAPSLPARGAAPPVPLSDARAAAASRAFKHATVFSVSGGPSARWPASPAASPDTRGLSGLRASLSAPLRASLSAAERRNESS